VTKLSCTTRFLHIINSSDTSKSVNGVLDEMSQLEETRKFHQSLYIKEQQNVTSGALTGKQASGSSTVICYLKTITTFFNE
jgi:hypothetical protein